MCNLCVHACMTPWTFRVNTPGAAGVLTRNVVLHLFGVGFPHVSVGGIVGNHWRLSSARSLFQRAIEPSNSRACDFQRYQVSLATHSPNGKTDSKPGCLSSSQCACPALPICPMVGRNPFSPQLQWPRPSSRRRCTWTPQLAWKNTLISMKKTVAKWFSTINHDMVTVSYCSHPPTQCNSSVHSLQVESDEFPSPISTTLQN